MKKLCSILLFVAFVFLCGLEVVPKFYQTATREVALPLFVESTRVHEREQGAAVGAKKEREIDYRQLTKGMNTKGA